MTVTGSARRDGVSVEVLPGGGLRSLELTPDAMRAGGAALSRTILALVREAAAQANQRARSAVADDVEGLRPEELDRLGLGQDASLTEVAESTTPDSWRA